MRLVKIRAAKPVSQNNNWSVDCSFYYRAISSIVNPFRIRHYYFIS